MYSQTFTQTYLDVPRCQAASNIADSYTEIKGRRERERERERERGGGGGRETDRQTDRQTDSQTDK